MLFDNDLTFLSVINIDNEEEKKIKVKLYEPTEGFIKGNMFENEYKPYKNYRPCMPKTTCEKTAKLYKIMELEFVINDLNLWLDIHPNDKKVFECLKIAIEKLCILENDYVKEYGPIKITDNIFDKNLWVKNWPWEKEDSIYV